MILRVKKILSSFSALSLRGLNIRYHAVRGTATGPGAFLRNRFNSRLSKTGVVMSRIVGLGSSKGSSYMPLLGLIPVVSAFSFGKKTDEKDIVAGEGKTSIQKERDILLQDADKLFIENEIKNLYDLLVQHKDVSDDNILWRLSRAAYHMSQIASDAVEKKQYAFDAFEYIQKALDQNDQNFACHKWYAIILNYAGEFEGTKQQITNAYKVKEHLLKAIELNPRDATTIHSLGFWCLTIADLPWYQRQIASVIFATPPTSSYEEALKYFLDAENVDPNFYSMNLMLLGKTYLRLKNKEKAKHYLLLARDYPVKTEDDKKAHKEAIELLSGIGVKE